MRKYFDTVIDSGSGRPIAGAQVTVTTSSGSPVQLYSDDGITPVTSPINRVTTNATGLFYFYVADGVYTLTYTFSDTTITISDVPIVDEIGVITASSARTRLSADRSLYVRTDGSDLGNGLTDASSAGSPNCAFATWQAAINAAMQLDTNGYDVIIRAGSEAGTKTWNVSSINVIGPTVGNGAIRFRGNGANTVLNSSGDVFFINGPVHAWIGNVKLISGGGYGCINVGGGANVGLEASGPIFGSAVNAHIFVHDNLGYFTALNSTYSIVGGAAAHLYAANNGTMAVEGCTVTITGSPTITNFAFAVNGGYIQSTNCTWTGSVTGRRYYADGGIISTLGNGANYFPGTTAGILTSGGSYLDLATVGFNNAAIATILKLGSNAHQIYDSAANEITIALANAGTVSSYFAFKNNGSGQPMLSGPSGHIGLASGSTEIAYADTNGLHLTQGGIYVPEASAASITTPASGNQALFIDTADHKLKRKDSSGTVTIIN